MRAQRTALNAFLKSVKVASAEAGTVGMAGAGFVHSERASQHGRAYPASSVGRRGVIILRSMADLLDYPFEGPGPTTAIVHSGRAELEFHGVIWNLNDGSWPSLGCR